MLVIFNHSNNTRIFPSKIPTFAIDKHIHIHPNIHVKKPVKKESIIKFIQYSIAFSMILGMLLTCFPRFFFFSKILNNYAAPIMLCYLGFSLLLMCLRQKQLMYISLGCCALLCLYLKNLDAPLAFSPPTKPQSIVAQKFSLAHFNLGLSDAKSSILAGIRSANADIVSIQEIRVDWLQELKDSLEETYTYQFTAIDSRLFGMGIFSKKPVKWFNNLQSDGLSNPVGCIRLSSKKLLHFASTSPLPALSPISSEKFTAHLQKISAYVHQQNGAVIVAGDFNAVPWSKEIKIFEEESNLKGSRHGFLGAIKSNDLFDLPFNHLFYSSDLLCHNFEPLSSSDGSFTGVKGIYSFKKSSPNAKKPNQKF